MFEKMVESGPAGRDLKDRRRYFVVSSVIVGILFSTAVVVSIFAADFSLGSSQLQLVELIAPTELEPAPEKPEPAPRTSGPASSSEVPIRQANIARLDEHVSTVPDGVSTTPNKQLARPARGNYNIGDRDSDPVAPGGAGRGETPGGGSPTGLLPHSEPVHAVPEDAETPPPPVVKKPEPPKTITSKGVLNGKAQDLPKPRYPPQAQAVGAQGHVNVQVLIDEKGRVISANAVSGHIMLRAEAERAALAARFSPTYLSDVPVKVTGIITYNFTR